MIQITKTINITNPVGTYTYQWSNGGDSCVSFNAISGTTTGVITTVITFTTEECIEAASLSITITDSEGCSLTQAVTVTNPCDSFTVSAITQQPNYVFSCTATSDNCTNFTYQWIYDESLFSLDGGITNSSGSIIDLNPTANIFPSSTTVKCKVTDCKGCQTEVSRVVLFCIPQPAPKATTLHYTENGYISAPLELTLASSCTTPIDWATLQFSLPNGFDITVDENVVIITADVTVANGSYSINYTVEDEDGIVSTQGTIAVEILGQSVQTISVLDSSIIKPCASGIGESLPIYIDDKVIISPIQVQKNVPNAIDWNSWQLLTTPSPLSSSIELAIDIDGNRYIDYEIPASGGTDVFKYTICDLNGSCADAATVTVILDCATSPSITNKSTCVACGSSSTTLVTSGGSNGGAPFQLNTIAITTSPTKGTVILPGDGTIVYTPNSGEIGSDTVQYTIKNAGGYTSNVATLTIDIICAGVDTTHFVCN